MKNITYINNNSTKPVRRTNTTIMIIEIDNTKVIQEIQTEFNKAFPYLMINFFDHGHKEFKGNSKKEMLPLGTKLSSIKHKNGKIEINEDMTVSELEHLFKTEFGLNVQVFRKSGRSWLETTVTDSWTLKKQNFEGKELSSLE